VCILASVEYRPGHLFELSNGNSFKIEWRKKLCSASCPLKSIVIPAPIESQKKLCLAEDEADLSHRSSPLAGNEVGKK
jgi:hypothetical protein